MDERREFCWISDGKDRLKRSISTYAVNVAGASSPTYSTEEDPVQIPFFGIQLESEPTSIANIVCGTFLSGDGGKACEERSLLADFTEKSSAGDVGNIMRDFEFSESTSTLCVDEPGACQYFPE